ncbi:MAG: hypothetical protein D3906_16435 [Candidatus Electrothrix sp. AUS1_2]|nr:hypothetical protein [Candidatus Electrothrix sp. AUS1_2]
MPGVYPSFACILLLKEAVRFYKAALLCTRGEFPVEREAMPVVKRRPHRKECITCRGQGALFAAGRT